MCQSPNTIVLYGSELYNEHVEDVLKFFFILLRFTFVLIPENINLIRSFAYW